MSRDEISRAQRFINEQELLPGIDRIILVDMLVRYRDWYEETDVDMDAIRRYIKDEELDTPTRVHSVLHKKFYLYKYLKTKFPKMSFRSIGEPFRKDHSSVLYGIAVHDNMIETKDSVYATNTIEIRKRFRL